MITLSIVSHGHSLLIHPLIDQLLVLDEVKAIIVTHNIVEAQPIIPRDRVFVIDNPSPKGFGANHNAAFAFSRAHGLESDYFCVLNPDISLEGNPFPALMNALQGPDTIMVGPQVVATNHHVEDSARYFPTLTSLLKKAIGLFVQRGPDIASAQSDLAEQSNPDWLAGMFMLFTTSGYQTLGGFDESYYLYYEDVDICARIWKSGKKLHYCSEVSVIHDARRASRKNLRFFKWHVTSLIRFMLKHGGYKRPSSHPIP